MHLLDHLFVTVFAILFPVAGLISFRRLRLQVAAGKPVDRKQLYVNTAAGEWLLFFLAILGWWSAGRPWTELGLSFVADRNFFVGVGLTLAGIVLLAWQVVQVRRADQAELRRIRQSFAGVTLMVPRNGNELARFYGLSVTAGIVEELLWRGYLFWYLGHFMPLWLAAAVSSVGFGLGHAYQGLAQVPAVILVGVAFAGLYLLTGSLWLPIVAHAAVDILQGRMACDVMHRSDFDQAAGGDAVATG